MSTETTPRERTTRQQEIPFPNTLNDWLACVEAADLSMVKNTRHRETCRLILRELAADVGWRPDKPDFGQVTIKADTIARRAGAHSFNKGRRGLSRRTVFAVSNTLQRIGYIGVTPRYSKPAPGKKPHRLANLYALNWQAMRFKPARGGVVKVPSFAPSQGVVKVPSFAPSPHTSNKPLKTRARKSAIPLRSLIKKEPCAAARLYRPDISTGTPDGVQEAASLRDTETLISAANAARAVHEEAPAPVAAIAHKQGRKRICTDCNNLIETCQCA